MLATPFGWFVCGFTLTVAPSLCFAIAGFIRDRLALRRWRRAIAAEQARCQRECARYALYLLREQAASTPFPEERASLHKTIRARETGHGL